MDLIELCRIRVKKTSRKVSDIWLDEISGLHVDFPDGEPYTIPRVLGELILKTQYIGIGPSKEYRWEMSNNVLRDTLSNCEISLNGMQSMIDYRVKVF
jgi:hypothetical protein